MSTGSLANQELQVALLAVKNDLNSLLLRDLCGVPTLDEMARLEEILEANEEQNEGGKEDVLDSS